MLEEVLAYLHNWFVVSSESGTFTVQDGSITLPFLQNGQYFRIIGSVFNDGLYQYNDELELTDETFDGTIYALAVPPAVISISTEITAWMEKYGDAVSAPFTSESFSGYSYTKASGSDSAVNWQTAFGARLAPYRKLKDTSMVQPSRQQDPPFVRPFIPGQPWG